MWTQLFKLYKILSITMYKDTLCILYITWMLFVSVLLCPQSQSLTTQEPSLFTAVYSTEVAYPIQNCLKKK